MRRLLHTYGTQLVLVLVVVSAFSVMSPQFRSFNNVVPLADGVSLLGLVALGVGLSVLVGEADLSVAAMAVIGGVLAIRLAPLGGLPALVVPVALACLYGAVQGWIVARFEVSSLLVTLASLIGLGGLAQILAHQETILLSDHDLGIADSLSVSWWALTPLSGAMLVACVGVGLLLAFTRFGSSLRAVGGGRAESRAAGIRPMPVMTSVFALSAGLSALAGALVALRSGAAAPDGYADTLLTAFAAVLIGGLELTGGRGNVMHVVLGCLVLRLLAMGTAMIGAPDYVGDIMTGTLLLSVLVLQRFGSALLRLTGAGRPRQAPLGAQG